MKYILLFFVLNSHIVYAEKNADPEFTTVIYNDQYPESSFKKNNVKVINANQSNQNSEILPVRERNKILNSVKGLNEIISTWDELDRDLLIIRTRTNEINKLKELYPELSEKQISELKTKLEKSK